MARPKKLRMLTEEDTWEDTLEVFLRGKPDLAETTRRDYLRLVRAFYSQPGVRFGKNEESFFNSFFRDPRLKPRTRNNRIAYMKAFWHFCLKQGILQGMEIDLDEIRKTKAEVRVVWLDQEEMEALLESLDVRLERLDSWAALRDRAMVILAITSGLRTSELRGLKIGDVSYERGVVHVRPEIAKTSKARAVPFVDRRARKALAETIAMHRRLFRNDEAPIFCNERGDELKQEAYFRRFRAICSEAEEILRRKRGPGARELRLTPYDLRHLFAARSVSMGQDLELVRETMGHQSILTTQQYMAFGNRRIVEEYGKLDLLEGRKLEKPVSERRARRLPS